MKIRTAPVVLGALAAMLAACASVETSAEYDRTVDFSKYRTYAWIENPEPMENAIARKRLTAAIEEQLAAKGLTKSDHPDLFVSMHARLTREVQSEPARWGYGPGEWQTGAVRTTWREIPVGTLVVDLVDAGRRDLVWRGIARRALDMMASAEEKDRAARDTLARMFADYPPRLRTD